MIKFLFFFFMYIFLSTNIFAEEAAFFIRGETYKIDKFAVNSEGTVKKIKYMDKEVDNIYIKIPAGSFDRKSNVSIGINNGILKLPSGRASNIVIDLQYEQPYRDNPPSGIRYPIEFTVKFAYDDMSRQVVIGYVVRSDGSLEPCQTYISGKNKFTFVLSSPAMFTWVYTEME